MKLNQFEILMLLGCVLAFAGSCFFRIRIFGRFADDPVISELMRGTYATTFGDFLSLKLFNAREELPHASRAMVYKFIALHWIGAAFFLLIFVSIALRSYW